MSSPLEFVAGGEHVSVSPDTLLVFLDETGDAAYRDKGYPVFGLGGCAILAADYQQEIHFPLCGFKQEHLGNSRAVLHGSEFRRQLTPAAVAALAQFFQKGEFFRFASFLTIDTQLSKGHHPYWVAGNCTFNRILELLQRTPAARRVALFAESGRDEQTERYLGQQKLWEDGELPVTAGNQYRRAGGN